MRSQSGVALRLPPQSKMCTRQGEDGGEGALSRRSRTQAEVKRRRKRSTAERGGSEAEWTRWGEGIKVVLPPQNEEKNWYGNNRYENAETIIDKKYRQNKKTNDYYYGVPLFRHILICWLSKFIYNKRVCSWR